MSKTVALSLMGGELDFGGIGWKSWSLADFFVSLRDMETVDCQGFQLSRYAADLVEREGIDVGLIKKLLDMSPRERLEYTQQAANFVRQLRESGKRMSDSDGTDK